MSGEPTSQNKTGPGAAKKTRSPLERVIVWGGIVVLLLLVAVQAHGRFGYEMSLGNLEPLIDDDREGGVPLELAEVGGHLVGFPSQTEMKIADDRIDRVYRWYGLGRSYGITLSYNPTAEPVVVTGLVTDEAPLPEPVPDEPSDDDPEMAAAAGGGGGGTGPPMHDAGGSGAGPGGSRGGFNPMENDADGDGKLSLEEVPERWRDDFAERDTDGDGLIDETEIEAMRERRRNGGGADGEGRPQRPPREGADEAGAAGTPPAEASDESSTSDEPATGDNEEGAAGTP